MVTILFVILGGETSPRFSHALNEDGTPRAWLGANNRGEGSITEEAWNLAIKAMGTNRSPTNLQAFTILQQVATTSTNEVMRLIASSCLGVISTKTRKAFDHQIHLRELASSTKWAAFKSPKKRLWRPPSQEAAIAAYAARSGTWMEIKWNRNLQGEIVGLGILDVPANYTSQQTGPVHATNGFTTLLVEAPRIRTESPFPDPEEEREDRKRVRPSARSILEEDTQPLLTDNHLGYAPEAERELNAHDCSRPSEMQVVRTDGGGRCDRHRPPLKKKKTPPYLLLQRGPPSQVKLRKCLLTRNSIPIHCGSRHRGQMIITPDVQYNSPIPITRNECQNLHQSLEYTIRLQPEAGNYRDKIFSLRLNATNQVSYNSFGETSLRSGCEGTEWFSNSAQKKIENVMEWRGDNLELKEESAQLDDEGRLTIFEDQVLLPARCAARKGFCQTPRGTWYWKIPSEETKCRLRTIRMYNGTEFTVLDQGKVATVFINDERDVRLVLKPEVQLCNRKVIPTNYLHLFLYADPRDTLLSKSIPIRDQDLNNYLDKPEFRLRESSPETLDGTAQKLLEAVCEDEVARKTPQYALLAAAQTTMRAGGTLSLGDGYFATATGEAWRTYYCKKLTVRALDADRCYDGLPVETAPLDRAHLLGLERQKEEREMERLSLKEDEFKPAANITFYLEPTTHRLTTTALEIPCVPQFNSYYQNKWGTWLIVTPTILTAIAPTHLPEAALDWRTPNEEGPGSEPDVPYTLREMQDMAAYRSRPQVQEQMIRNLAEGIPVASMTDPLQSSSFLHHLGLQDARVTHFFTAIYEWINKWKHPLLFMAAAISLYTLSAIAIKVMQEAMFPHIEQHFCKRMFHVWCPGGADLMHARERARQLMPHTMPPPYTVGPRETGIGGTEELLHGHLTPPGVRRPVSPFRSLGRLPRSRSCHPEVRPRTTQEEEEEDKRNHWPRTYRSTTGLGNPFTALTSPYRAVEEPQTAIFSPLPTPRRSRATGYAPSSTSTNDEDDERTTTMPPAMQRQYQEILPGYVEMSGAAIAALQNPSRTQAVKGIPRARQEEEIAELPLPPAARQITPDATGVMVGGIPGSNEIELTLMRPLSRLERNGEHAGPPPASFFTTATHLTSINEERAQVDSAWSLPGGPII
jgi:hypothetical protein